VVTAECSSWQCILPYSGISVARAAAAAAAAAGRQKQQKQLQLGTHCHWALTSAALPYRPQTYM